MRIARHLRCSATAAKPHNEACGRAQRPIANARIIYVAAAAFSRSVDRDCARSDGHPTLETTKNGGIPGG